MKQRIVVETVDDDDDELNALLKYIRKHVAKFWDTDMFFGTVMGVREVNDERP